VASSQQWRATTAAMLHRLPQFFTYQSGRNHFLKVFFKLHDGGIAETVLVRGAATTPHGAARHTVCVSSQLGCRRGCRHCSSGARPFARDLTCSEMLGQVAAFAVGHEIDHVAFHGTGEPLDNPEVREAAVLLSTRYDDLVCSCDGGHSTGVADRAACAPSVCLSTAGSSRAIGELARSAPSVRLMLSMTPEIERGEPMEELLRSTDEFCRCTGRPVGLSYTMIDGIDTREHAEGLLQHMQGRTSTHLVSLIQYHSELDTAGGCGDAAQPSSPDAIRRFMERLEAGGCQVSFGQFCEFPSQFRDDRGP